MINTVDLPTNAANGPGTAVDTSELGAIKTLVFSGNAGDKQPFVIIEVSNDDAGANWSPLVMFNRPGQKTVTVACLWMRANVTNYRGGGAPVVSLGANESTASFASLPTPGAGGGDGAGVDVSSMPALKTIQVSGEYGGAINIEISNDGGTSYELLASFIPGNQGIQTLTNLSEFMRVTRPSSATGTPVVNIGAVDLGGASSGNVPLPPFGSTTTTIYARPTGDDETGNGTLALPYETMQRAVRDVPLDILPLDYYKVDMTGCDETLPANYTLPPWKAGWSIDSTLVNDPDFLFVPAVQIQAIPELADLPDDENVIAAADIVGQVSDPVSQLIRITVTAPRASWAANALKGYFVEDGAGVGGNNATIWQSDTTFLVICTSTALGTTSPIRITKPGARIRGTSSGNTVATGSARGCLRAVNCDSVGFAGLDIANSGGLTSPGLALGGNGAMFAQMCWLQSPTLQAWSPSLVRTVRCWITGSPSYSGFFTIQASLCDTWTGNNFLNVLWAAIRVSVFDACATIEPKTFFPGTTMVGCPVLFWYMLQTVVANTPGATGDAIRLHGLSAQLTQLDVYNAGRDGIRASGGSGGKVQISACGTTSADGVAVVANAAYGVNVQDGMQVSADVATSTAAKPLTGTTNQTLVGALAAQTWAAWTAGGANKYDITAVAAGGATGSGSRLYQGTP